MKDFNSKRNQDGSAMIEALVALVLFAIGVLALVSLQAVSVKNSADAKYRSDAAYLASQIISRMWVDRTNVDKYANYATGTNCAFSGAASSNSGSWVTPVTAWATQAASLLPGSGGAMSQIQVTSVTGGKQVRVVICWKGPQETITHNYAATAQINVP